MQKFLHASPRRPEVALLGGHIASLVVWMYTKSFTTLCSALDDKKERSKKKKTPHHNERSYVAQKKRKGPASLFGREAEVLFGA